ncbi:MAG: GntR family transcriptional regulator [Lachnospiraceae bacterium]|nr:GntR family transcriptional regulator [Lachnospiraceae bacterium]
MTWKLDSDRPIYSQLVEEIRMQIVSGAYPPGSKLPSVRELASDAGVNPNTMQRAFTELERNGLIETRRTNGRFVTEDGTLIRSIRRELAGEQLTDFFHKMEQLGYQKQEVLSLITSVYEEESLQ